MVRAIELQSVGYALESLFNLRVSDKSDLDAWYAEARRIRQEIVSKPDLSDAMPTAVWHFLSDADIRLKDPRYAALQLPEIDRIILVLKRGQVPVE